MRVTPTKHNPSGRPTCFSCFRPYTHCLCNFVQPFAAHCNVLILQHPNERKKYYSTAKLVLNTLTNSKLTRSIEFPAAKLPLPSDPVHKTYLLYPSSNAVDCETVSLKENVTVIVIDGTWSEAKKIIRLNSILSEYSPLTFKRPLRSSYAIRKQPKDHYLSTIESVAHFLKLNSLAAGNFIQARKYDCLLDLFNRMVDQQLAYFPKRSANSA